MKHNPDLHAVRSIEQRNDEPPRTIPRRRTFADQLRERKVCRAAITYMLVAWLNLQIADIVFPMLGFPDWTLKFVVLIGVMGFPVALILAWLFQITPSGIVLDLEGDSEESASERQMDRVVNVLLLGLSILFAALLMSQFLYLDDRDGNLEPPAPHQEQMAQPPLGTQPLAGIAGPIWG